MAVHLSVAGGVFDRVFCAVFFHEMSWMRSGTKFSPFLRIFLSTHAMSKYDTLVRTLMTEMYGRVLSVFPIGVFFCVDITVLFRIHT